MHKYHASHAVAPVALLGAQAHHLFISPSLITPSSTANVLTAHTLNEVTYPNNLALTGILSVLVHEIRAQSLLVFLLFSPACPLQI